MSNQNVKALSAQFRFKAEQTIDESMIMTEHLEHRTSGFIAGRLIAALEKEGYLQQEFNEEQLDAIKRYHYSMPIKEFDIREIAMLAVQLSGILIHIDSEMDLEEIVNTRFVYKRFNDIALANKTMLPHCYPSQKKDYWVSKARAGFKLAIKADLLTEVRPGIVIRSKRYLGSCISRKAIVHQNEPITLDNRRKERVKTRLNPKKDGTSNKVREALEFIESQAQIVNEPLLDSIQKFINDYKEFELALPEEIMDSLHVIEGCQQLRGENALYSEYFQDLRGRIYQYSHGGPNPQSSDLARALCYHTVENVILKDSEQYEIFMNELKDEVACSEYAMLPQVLEWVANNPVDAIKEYFREGSDISNIKKFWTYLVLARDWYNFEQYGYADCRIGFGPDAKCSGAQILSILAGCEDLGAACGLTTASERPKDPYVRSCDQVDIMQNDSRFKGVSKLVRSEIKTPFMAIQYGGGVPSLRYKKFEQVMNRKGIPFDEREDYCKLVIEGIREALGFKVNQLIDNMRIAVGEVLEKTGKDYFDYKHIDGFKCTKRGDAEVKLTDHYFVINFGQRGNGVIFGTTEESKTGQQSGWIINSNKSDVLQAANFIYYFPVHFVQGLDAVIARQIALECKKMGIRGYTSIHDQFRSCLEDAPKMREAVNRAYREVFINNDPLEHLNKQLAKYGVNIVNPLPLQPIKKIVTEEVLQSPNAFFFE